MISGNYEALQTPVRQIAAKAELINTGSADTTKSGKFVYIDDAQPVMHSVAVEVKCKNMIDFFNITAQEDIIYISSSDGTVYNRKGYRFKNLEEEKKYTLSFTFHNDSSFTNYLYLYKIDKNTRIHKETIYLTTEIITNPIYTFTAEKDCEYFVRRGGGLDITQTEINKFATFQLEKGSTKTEYVPYINDYSGIDVVRTGKNLAKPKVIKNETITGITVDIQDDGTYLINGKATVDYANGYLTNYLIATHGNRNRYPAGTYTVTVRELGGYCEGYIGMAINAPSGTTYPGGKIGSTKVILTEESELSVFVQFLNGKVATDYHISLQIDKGDKATDYEPYTEQRVTVSADGIATGITSLPTMMLYNDTNNAALNIGYKSTVNNNILSSTDDINSITIDRIGESKFFGYGVSQKANIRIRDIERAYAINTSTYFKLYFNDLCAFPLFHVTEVHRDENTNELSITVYDELEKAAAHTVSELNIYSYTIGEFAKACGALLGLETVLPELLEFGLSYEEGANFEGTESIREALNDVAEATQTIYYINANNQLTFKRLDIDGEPLLTIRKDDYITLDSKTNRRLAGICSATELGDNVEAKLEQSGTTQYVRDNAFWELREDIADLVDSALAAIGGLTINQFNCNWRGNYLAEIGDKIALVTKDNETVISYLLDDSISYTGAYSQATQWQFNDEAASANNPTSLGEVIKQTYARVDKQNKEISIVASEASANAAAISSIVQNTNSINATVESIKTQANYNTGEIAELTNKVSAQITPEQVNLAIQSALDNGVDKVETSTGFTFNEQGLTVSKSNSEMRTTITEDGMQVYKNNSEVLTANNEGVKAIDLHAETFLIIGKNSRFEDYGRNRTGCFWIGG